MVLTHTRRWPGAANIPELAEVQRHQPALLTSSSGLGAPMRSAVDTSPPARGQHCSEVLLPPLLCLNGIQDWLPLRLVLLSDLFDLLLHHGVQGQQPLLQILHGPTLELGGKCKVWS